MQNFCYRLYLIKRLVVCTFVLQFSSQLFALDNNEFVTAFIRNYDQQNFTAQVGLVKANKKTIPATITRLTSQALHDTSGFDEQMYLLNIASSIAYMHFHWNADAKPLDILEPIIAKQLKQEQVRLDTLTESKKKERMLGNFVMNRHEQEMRKQGLSMVLYPHWLHRIMFECKVCHNDVFKMKRWVNNISQQDIVAGRQCGICHNGTLAFSATDNCERCHLAGKAGAEHLHKPSSVSQARIKKAAEKVGAKWRPENLANGVLPLDKFQFINWLELKRRNVFTPIASLDKTYQEKLRDNRILFRSKSDFVNDVIFDHKIHSDWIKCSSCHPAIFKDKLGGNNIKMMDMHRGRFCGHCHGKVSFSFADCKRCHKESNKHPPPAILIR